MSITVYRAARQVEQTITQIPSGAAVASHLAAQPQVPDDGLPAESTGGFDGKLAYGHVAKQVSFGPRPSGSQAILQVQDYITSQLTSSSCTVDADSFSADTPAGRLPMKNIVVKIPGERQGIILLATHYDTKRLDNFVGADDAARRPASCWRWRDTCAETTGATLCGLPSLTVRKLFAKNGRIPTIDMEVDSWPRKWE
jgi:hypothetical protein